MMRGLRNHGLQLRLRLPAFLAGVIGLLLSVMFSTGAEASGAVQATNALRVIAGQPGQEEDSHVCAQGRALSALLYWPSAVAVFGGNVYVADAGDNCVLEIHADGTITRVAGTGHAGFNGNGIPATQAELSDPQGLAFDKAGDLYIADSGNERIRVVTTTGIIKLVAGRTQYGFSGDGGPAVSAELNYPLGVAADAHGDVFISDTQNERIREITPNGQIHTIAGTGALGFNGDNQPARRATLHTPAGIAAAPDGTVYFGDVGNNRVRTIDPQGIIHTVAGDAEPGGYNPNENIAVDTPLYNPYSIALDSSGDLFIADTTNCLVREVVPAGTITQLVGLPPTTAGGPRCKWNGDGLPPGSSNLNRPYGIAVGPAGHIIIADTYNEVVRKY
jgi:hypothetical protein